jgi:hypothetical protein
VTAAGDSLYVIDAVVNVLCGGALLAADGDGQQRMLPGHFPWAMMELEDVEASVELRENE